METPLYYDQNVGALYLFRCPVIVDIECVTLYGAKNVSDAYVKLFSS